MVALSHPTTIDRVHGCCFTEIQLHCSSLHTYATYISHMHTQLHPFCLGSEGNAYTWAFCTGNNHFICCCGHFSGIHWFGLIGAVDDSYRTELDGASVLLEMDEKLQGWLSWLNSPCCSRGQSAIPNIHVNTPTTRHLLNLSPTI